MRPSRRTVLRRIGAGTALALGGVGVASADDSPDDGTTIADAVVSDDDFDKLEAAVKYANLVGTLDGNRQLTVFAPDDEAFNEFLGSKSLNDFSRSTVRSILTYHVAPGERKAASVVDAEEVPTLNGALIDVDGTTLNDGQATIEGPNYFDASNGVIHRIDGVLQPP